MAGRVHDAGQVSQGGRHFRRASLIRCSLHRRTAISSIAALAALIAAGAGVMAVAQDLTDGLRIWKNKAGCPQCHGWAGDGFPAAFHSEGNAPSLRVTQLNRDQIRETVQCGRPGTSMPHFDRFAYTDKRCYDLTAEDLGNRVPDRS